MRHLPHTASTKLQREADDLDLAIFRVVGSMLAFAETLPRGKQKPLRDAATNLGVARSLVREHMHPERRKEMA